MANGVELATAYVTLTIDGSEISKSISSGFAGGDKIAAKAGQSMGRTLSRSLEQSTDVDLDTLRAEVETAEKKITASVEVNAAKQTKAKRAVQIAEAELEEKRASGRASVSQVMKAEDKLSIARQKLEAATMAATADQAKFTAELDQTKAALREAEAAATSAADGTRSAFSGLGDFIRKSMAGDFSGAFTSLKGDAATAANQVEGEFAAAGDDAGEGFSDGFLDKVKGISGAVAGLGIGLSLTEGITSGMERERLSDRLSAQLNLVGPQAEIAGQVAGNLYAGAWGESLDEAHDAVAAVMSSLPGMMDAPASAIEGITAKAMDLTTAFDVDMNEAVGAIGVMMRNGLATDADQAMDLMVGSLQKVPAGFRDELFPAITEYGKHFSGLGMDGATAMGLLVRGAENGVIGVDKMGDAVKEFQIRSTDMSKATGEAYDTIGLDMGAMTTELLAGGDRAETAFGQIIHGLQGIEDPSAQSAAALALFGTPLEDLSVSEIPNFLGAMDPAGAAFDDMAGAAERMGTTLNDNAATNLESFKRTLGTGFVEIVGTGAGALMDLGAAAQPIIDFLRETAPQWAPFAIGIGITAAAYGIYAAAAWVATAAQGAFAGTLWATVAAVAPWIIGIGLVVGAVLYAWNHFDGFRNLVLGVWDSIKIAIGAAVTWFQTVAVPWIQSALAVAGAAFTWLWNNVITPVWNGIVAAITWAWNGFIMPVFQELVRFIQVIIAPAALWLWHNIIGPAFSGISTAIQWAWNTVIRPVFQALWAFITNVLGPVIGWLWNTIVAPAFKGIGAIIQFVWENVIRVAFRSLEWFLKTVLGPAINWLWNNVAKPAFEGIGNAVKWAWENVIRPAFDGIKTGVDLVKKGFENAQSGIASAWEKLKAAVKDPISMVVNKVINPFIGGYNDLNDFWSGDDLKPITGFARGGILPGYQSAKKDELLTPMRKGEGVLVPEAVRGIGAEAVHTLNEAGNSGGVAAARKAWAGMHQHDDPANMAIGARVYGGVQSFVGPQFEEIRRTGELNVAGSVPGWGLDNAIRMADAATVIKVQRGNGRRMNGVTAYARNYPAAWDGYYQGDDGSIMLNEARAARFSPHVRQAITAHELGHALALPHNALMHGGNGVQSIMNYDNFTQHGSYTSADVAALSAIYGGSGKAGVGGGDGEVMGIGGWIAEQLKKVVTAPIDAAKKAFAGNKFVQMPLGIADKVIEDAIDFAVGGSGDSGGVGEAKVAEWMTKALKLKGMFSETHLKTGIARAMHESGGDPGVIQQVDDVNSRSGNHARGLMQVIPTTFNAFKESGYDDIFDPIDNILASINYTVKTWGSLQNGWGDLSRGYALGGVVGEEVSGVWDDPIGTVHQLRPGASTILNGTGSTEYFQRVPAKPEPLLNASTNVADRRPATGEEGATILQVENMFGTPKEIVNEVQRRKRRANYHGRVRQIGKVSIG
jgi:phage-related minor tail protein